MQRQVEGVPFNRTGAPSKLSLPSVYPLSPPSCQPGRAICPQTSIRKLLRRTIPNSAARQATWPGCSAGGDPVRHRTSFRLGLCSKGKDPANHGKSVPVGSSSGLRSAMDKVCFRERPTLAFVSAATNVCGEVHLHLANPNPATVGQRTP